MPPPAAAGARRGEDASAGAAAGAGVRRRTGVEDGLPAVAVLRFRAPAALRDAVAFRAPPVFRAPKPRFRAAPVLFRLAPVRFLLAPVRFRLAPARVLLRFLPAAARFVFFLPRGGILLLRELGSQSGAGEANSLPAFVTETAHRGVGSLRDSVARDDHRVAIRVVMGRFRMSGVDANAHLAHHFRGVEASVYAIAQTKMTKKQHPRSKRGQPPPEHRPAQVPRARPIPRTPSGEPMAQAPRASERKRAPKERGIGAPPNPQKPRLVRDVHGNELKDLFEFFPDLPHPARPAARVPSRHPRRR